MANFEQSPKGLELKHQIKNLEIDLDKEQRKLTELKRYFNECRTAYKPK